MERHIVGFVSYPKVGEHAAIRRKLWQYLVAYTFADRVCIVDIDLHTGRVVTPLADLAFAYEIEALDDLKRRFPDPNVGAKLEIFGSKIVQTKAHKKSVRQNSAGRFVISRANNHFVNRKMLIACAANSQQV